MNLTLKLSLPLLIGMLLIMSYLHFVWEPDQLAKGKVVFEQQNQALLESTESALIRDILEGNFAALIANIDYLLKKHEGVWFNMEIFSDDGKRLYPLFDSSKVANTGEHDFIHHSYPLRLAQSDIGKIVIDFNWFEAKRKIQRDVNMVRNMLLSMVMFSLLVMLFTQMQIIVRPLTRLRDATRKIAEGKLEILLPRATHDEVGELTNSFRFMTQELSFKQGALDLHANVSIADSHGCITYINENFIKTTGYSREELLGQNHRLLKSGIHPPEFYKDLWKTVNSGKTWKREICNLNKNGEYYWIDVTIVPQIGRNSHSKRFIAIGTDITKRKKAEAELVESRQLAETANLAKSRFLANMSHEFRTPLNSVIGMTQMLTQRQELDPDVREEVDRINIAGQMLLSLVNDFLDLSKIGAGEINLEKIPMQLEQVFEDLESMLLPLARKKGLEFCIVSEPELSKEYVISDPTRLRQMLLNLLNNAIKFTRSGSISLSMKAVGPIQISDNGAPHRQLHFLVKDTGCGIPHELLHNLFEAFRQADSSITRKHGGTGLGLAIVKQLCEEMGGTVHVESIINEGSCFTIELPFRIATEKEVKEADMHSKHLKVLIAEDDPGHRGKLIDMSNQLGWDVEAISNGRELLHRYEELLDQGHRIDCLIVDWQMPELDGLEALSRIKEKYSAEETPAILVVSDVERERLHNYPQEIIPDIILNKPLTISTLVNGLIQVFNQKGDDFDLVTRSSTLDFAQLAWLPEVKVLVVDDAQVNLDLTTRLFKREGAVVFTCTNGAEALDWLRSPDNCTDIVLMDIQMPVMDGNTAVQEIRKIESLKELPIIALTAAALASERKISLEAGMDDYQTKPFDTEKMIRLIRRYVGISKGVPVPVRAKHGIMVENLNWPVIEGIEPEGVRERINDDLDLFMDLLKRFTNENGDLLHPVELPLEQPDKKAMEARMHKIAGNAGLVGAIALSTLARKIENNLRSNTLNETPQLIQQLRVSFYHLNEAIVPILKAIKKESSVDEPGSLTNVELNELREALEQKKIVSTKLYRNLQPALRDLMKEEAFHVLDKAMEKLEFSKAQKQLEHLSVSLPAEDSPGKADIL